MPIRTRSAVGLLAAAALLGCDAERTTVPTMEGSSAVAEGNGLPDNGHARLYKFNLIGVPKDKKPDMTVDAGKRMFVKLEAPSKIYLQEGDDFDILAVDIDIPFFAHIPFLKMRRMRVASRRCTNFRQPAVRITALIASRSGGCGTPINRKGCDQRPLCGA